MDVKFIVFLAIVGVVTYATLRINPKGPKNGLGKVTGYVLVFATLLVLANTALPRFLTKQSANMNNWDPFWNQASTAVNGATDAVANVFGMNAPDIPGATETIVSVPENAVDPDTAVSGLSDNTAVSGTTGPLQYIVTNGDTLGLIAGRYGVTVDELKTANNLTGDLIVPDQILQIPINVPQAGGGGPGPDAANMAVPDETAVETNPDQETPEMAPKPISDNTAVKARVYQDLAAAKADGNIRAGEAAVATLFSFDVNDPTAVTANDEITMARRLMGNYDALANQTDHEAARGVMYGRTFLVIDDGAATWTFSSCKEMATVQQVTQDWLRGYTFQIRRCVMSGYGDGTPATGETFAVK